MTSTVEALSQEALSLTPAERLALVERVLNSLDVPDSALEKLWTQEADERLAAYRRGEIQAASLSDVLAKYSVPAQK